MFSNKRKRCKRPAKARKSRKRSFGRTALIGPEPLESRLLLAVVPWSGDLADGTVWSGGDVHHLTVFRVQGHVVPVVALASML